MASIEQKSIAAPDETRQFPGGKYEVVNLTAGPVGKGTFEPGWKWSESLKQAAGTEHARCLTSATSSRGGCGFR